MTEQQLPPYPWLQSYPAGMPAEIEALEYSSLAALFAHSVQRFGNQPALSNFAVCLSYRQLDILQQRFSSALSRKFGLVKGDRIALMMPNVLQYPVCLLGALRIGLVVVNTNPLYTARELRHQLLDSGAKAIVVLENFAHVVAEVTPELPQIKVIVTAMGDLLGFKGKMINTVLRLKGVVPRWHIQGACKLPELLAKIPAETPAEAVAIAHDDLAFLQYTGGTTGVSRGAMLSHANMLANIQQANTWIASKVRPGKDIVITALPLYHIFALMANMFIYMYNGALSVLITNPRDTSAFIKQIRHQHFTAMTGVNTLFDVLLNHPRFDDIDFSALRLSLGGGMALQRQVAERWEKRTGCPIIEAYGLTETSPAVCVNRMDQKGFNGSVGLPLPSTEVCVRSEGGSLLASSTAGELHVRGPQVMRGYWPLPEAATTNPDMVINGVAHDGWFATGDIATIDEQGFVHIIDRKKDMINVSGFNVYPTEVENVIATHPEVLEVGVVGILNDAGNEQIKAVIVRKTPHLDAPTLQQWCRKYLLPYKIPKIIEFVEELPKTNVGKILRRALKTIDPA